MPYPGWGVGLELRLWDEDHEDQVGGCACDQLADREPYFGYGGVAIRVCGARAEGTADAALGTDARAVGKFGADGYQVADGDVREGCAAQVFCGDGVLDVLTGRDLAAVGVGVEHDVTVGVCEDAGGFVGAERVEGDRGGVVFARFVGDAVAVGVGAALRGVVYVETFRGRRRTAGGVFKARRTVRVEGDAEGDDRCLTGREHVRTGQERRVAGAVKVRIGGKGRARGGCADIEGRRIRERRGEAGGGRFAVVGGVAVAVRIGVATVL